MTGKVVTCRLPEDVEQLERLNSAMSNLATDNDRDVAGEARAVNDLFKRTPVSPLAQRHPVFVLIHSLIRLLDEAMAHTTAAGCSGLTRCALSPLYAAS